MQQETTVHVVRHRDDDGRLYRVWLGSECIGECGLLTTARRIALGTQAPEMVECWESGKAFERGKRGGWRVVG